MGNMNPYMSWAILLVVVGGLGWYYTNGSHPKGKTTVNRAPVEKGEASISSKKPKPKPKAKKSPEPSGLSTPTTKPEEESRNTPTSAVVPDNNANDEVDNKDFALRLSKAKDGTSIVPATKNGQSKKDRRNQKLKTQQGSGSSEVPGSQESNRSSSTAGGDADDDMSPVTSPIIAPATGDVSDMLENPTDGPSVLRLTGDVNDKKKQKKPQQFKPVETKKQRQQKAKNEAKRLQVEEAEKQRRSLLEKQLHTSREIERQEASRSKPAAPVNNAWAMPVSEKSNGAAIPPAVPRAELLDTFTPVSSGKKTNGTTAKAPRQPKTQQENSATQASETAQASKAQAGNWTDELPSEEEQMRMLGAMSSENEWTTVPKRKKEKKAEKVNGNEVES